MNKNMFTSNYIRFLLESTFALRILESMGYEIVYLDKFSTNLKK